MPNVLMIRDYGWRGSCLAGGVTDAGVGSGDRLGISPQNLDKRCGLKAARLE
jgi:hypothetical protein